MIVTTSIVSAVLITLHIKYRKTYNDKFEELIKNEIDFAPKIVEKKNEEIEHDNMVIKIENEKFEHFINSLNTS
jgi:hypothetical protein